MLKFNGDNISAFIDDKEKAYVKNSKYTHTCKKNQNN
jgi:hypothetical protein